MGRQIRRSIGERKLDRGDRGFGVETLITQSMGVGGHRVLHGFPSGIEFPADAMVLKRSGTASMATSTTRLYSGHTRSLDILVSLGQLHASR